MNAPRLAAALLCVAMTTAAPAWAASPAAAPASATPAVDPAAVKALREMSDFLKSLSTFKLTSQTSMDLVTNDDQKIQLDGMAYYTVRKPDAFLIDVVSDAWNRQLFYNGREFTLYAPKLGYYSTIEAPATIQATIADVEERFGLSIPLDDLFRWSGPDGARADSLDSGFLVGEASLDGVKTNQYAFRAENTDWQIWIQQGDQPLPLKLLIVDRKDASRPQYVARLKWTLNPPLTDADFAFRPGSDAKRIRINLQQ